MQTASNARLRASKRCRSWSTLLMDSLATGHRVALWRVPCKSWSCPRCARKKAQSVSHKARINFQGGRIRFLTLTIRPQASLPGAITHINRSWNRLRLNITRFCGKVKYAKFLEPQPSTGMPHFHVLLDKYIPAAWLNHAVVKAGFGPIYKIKLVRDELVFGYVLKYLRKGIEDDAFLDALLTVRGRRYAFSQKLIPYNPSSGLKPVRIYKHDNIQMIDALLNLFWMDISISSGYYPLSISNDFVYFFKPAPVPLLPAPPASGASSPVS